MQRLDRAAAPPSSPPKLETRVLALLDLTGYTRFCESGDEFQVAGFLREFYRLCRREVGSRGGRVVKFMGDACFASFPEDRGPDAIAAILAIREAAAALGEAHGFETRLGANVHEAKVAVLADGGPDGDAEDLLGAGVNHLFLMGGGGALRITEPVYRSLPSDRRAGWDKQKPPARYVFTG